MFMVLERWPDDGKHKPRSSTSQAVLQLLPFQNLVAPPEQQRHGGLPHSPTYLFFVLVEIRIDGVHALHASKNCIHITQLVNFGSQLAIL